MAQCDADIVDLNARALDDLTQSHTISGDVAKNLVPNTRDTVNCDGDVLQIVPRWVAPRTGDTWHASVADIANGPSLFPTIGAGTMLVASPTVSNGAAVRTVITEVESFE